MNKILMLLPAEIDETKTYTGLTHPDTGLVLVDTKSLCKLQDDCFNASTMAFTIELNRAESTAKLEANYKGSPTIIASIKSESISDMLNLSVQL